MSKINSLLDMLRTTITPDDVIMTMLSTIKANTLTKDLTKFHRSIFLLKNDADFSELLRDFEFTTKGLSPVSDLLESVLFRLEVASILPTKNPTYEFYDISDTKSILARNISKFSNVQQSLISRMGERFETLMN